MACVIDVEYCVVKGTSWEASAAFSVGYTEVIENPQDYEGIFVFREYQDDGATVYLTLRADVVEVPPDVPASITFRATPTQTTALPDWDIVAYCDLQRKDGTVVQRLFNATVEVSE